MGKLSEKYTRENEEGVIIEGTSIRGKYTKNIVDLYNHEEMDHSIGLGRITHPFWNLIQTSQPVLKYGRDEGNGGQLINENFVEDDPNEITSLAFCKGSSNDSGAGGIITTETNVKNSYTNNYNFLTEFDFNNIYLVPRICDTTGSDTYADYNKYIDNATNNILSFIINVYYVESDFRFKNVTRYITPMLLADNKIIDVSQTGIGYCRGRLDATHGPNYYSANIESPRVINDSLPYWFGSQANNWIKTEKPDIPWRFHIAGQIHNSGYWWQKIWTLFNNKNVVEEIVASLGVKYITCDPATITSKEQLDAVTKIAFMNKNGVIDYNNIIQGQSAIDASDTYNKNIGYNDTQPEISKSSIIIPSNNIILQKSQSQNMAFYGDKKVFHIYKDNEIIF